MIFDQYQRYKIIQIIVNKIKEYYCSNKLTVLEVGSNEQLNLGNFLPNEEIVYSDLFIPKNIKEDINFIKLDATNMEDIKDNQFDIVISLDVFEHIPREKRRDFLKETNRVAKIFNIHSFPFEDEAVSSAELRANDYYKSIFGKDHVWLKEHIENGLPNIDNLKRELKLLTNDNYYMFEHGDIFIWEDMMKALFYSYYNSDLELYRSKIDDFYQKNIFLHDVGEKNYRKFLAITNDKNLIKKLEGYIKGLFDKSIPERKLEFLYRSINDLHDITQLPKNIEKLQKNCKATLYFNDGNGYRETFKREYRYKIEKSHGIIDIYMEKIPEGVYRVRFDPIEGKTCIISGIKVISDKYLLNYKILNGYQFEDEYIFHTDDPQIEVDFDDKRIKWIKIRANICIVDDMSIISIIDKLNKYNEINKADILKYQKLNEENKEENHKQYLYINKLNDELEDTRNELLNARKELMNVKNELVNTNTELMNVRMSWNEISNSTIWRATKILRNILDYVKRINNDACCNKLAEEKEVKYSIDKIDFNNNILEISGWIFDLNMQINKLNLLIISYGNEYRINLLTGLERNDVYERFNSENALNSGFSGKIRIQNFRKIYVYLEFNEEKRILISKIKNPLLTTIKYYKNKINKGSLKKALILIKNRELNRLKVASKKLVIESVNNKYNCISLSEFIKENIVENIVYNERLYDFTIDIIIPVYNGFVFLEKLFESLCKTKMMYRLIIVNDNSTDSRVNEYLKNYSNNNLNVILIENNSNLGFVKSVNKALKVCDNHVVLLNTDVELPNMWLERLMAPIILKKDIASSTPFTNCGTICSFPKFCEDNDIFEGMSLNDIDNEFRKILPRYSSLPTGVGFCMGINKVVLDEIGLLDEDKFDKGYGEENDWCQRAIKAGYKNVYVENLFVYHKHGGSFLSDQKKKLLERNSKILLRKHPNYNVDVADFCEKDPAKHIRDYLIFKLLSNSANNICVYFDHNIGGGASIYLNERIHKEIGQNKNIIVIKYDIYNQTYLFNYKYKNYDIMYYLRNFSEVNNVLYSLDIGKIVINELVTYPKLYSLLKELQNIKNNKNIEMVMLLHDYFAICPTINLLDNIGKYCGLPCIDKCEQCLKSNTRNNYLDYESINKWRREWGNFLTICDKIIVFSEDSNRLLQKIYNNLNNIEVRPHKVNYMIPLNKRYKYTKTLNIGLLGTLAYHKGFEIIKNILSIIEKDNLEINIILIGSTTERIKHNNFRQTGPYTIGEVPRLILENDIDLFLISSIWPETFSYTTEEIIKMDLPIVSFNIGAPVERISKYKKGLILKGWDEKECLKSIIDFSEINRYRHVKNKKKILFIAEDKSFTTRYRVDHFRENLLINGINSDFSLVENLKENIIGMYSNIVVYRCNNCEKMERIIAKAKKLNIKVFYDIDDYIFDYEKIKYLDFLNDNEYKGFDKQCKKINKCMELCDEYITSTENLKKIIEDKFKKPVYIKRNMASMEMLVISLKAKTEIIRDDNKIVIGYFSGSKTHNKDFDLVSDTILKLMEENNSVNLKIVGCLRLNDKFNKYKNRIEKVNFVDWKCLPYEIASVDINLLPVEDTIFHRCKSENKWMEAALVGVPTIASYNTELERVISDGRTGLLCNDEHQWYNKLNRLVKDDEYRERIGISAHKYVLENYITNNLKEEVVNFIFKQD